MKKIKFIINENAGADLKNFDLGVFVAVQGRFKRLENHEKKCVENTKNYLNFHCV